MQENHSSSPDCHIDLDDKVWLMVNPGGSIEDAFDKSDLEAQVR